MTLIDLSGEIPDDPFAWLLEAWAQRRWQRRPGESSAPGWEVEAVDVDGRPGWLLQRVARAGKIVHGSGEAFLGPDLTGGTRLLINRETNGAAGVDLAYLNAPFIWSDDGWGLHIETGAPVLMDLSGDTYTVLVLDPDASFRTMSGTPAQILEAHTARTGRAPLWPDWAYGVWMSRATYLSAREMLDVVADLQAADCPVDVIHVDAWMTGNVFRDFTTNWEVDRERFPVGWTRDLREAGARVSMWLNPFVHADTELAADLHARGFLVRMPDGSPATTCDRNYRNLVDFTNPAAQAWWQGRILDLVTSEQPDALKLDFAEEVPPDAVMHDGRSALLLRNSYAMLYQRATARALEQVGPAMPLFCRSGSVGAQIAPCHWVGDTPSTWEAMAGALAACLSLSASGFALVTHDGGGFYTAGTSHIPATLLDGGEAHYTADVEPELYARWAQFAAFSPVTRFHGLGLREPTAYPQPWRDVAIEALRARRGIVGHIRRAHEQATQTGMPVMRPMALVTDDAQGRGAHSQYLLGDDLLVAPILQRGGHTRMWLPEGTWRPLLGSPQISGDVGWVDVQCDPGSFPVFERV